VIGCGPPTARRRSLPTAAIRLAGRRIEVEIARTRKQRRVGMMHRRAIGPDEGMLFVFPDDAIRSFYMKNTHVPLSIAFIRADGTIDRIADMTPLSLRPHRSDTPCRFALEMPRGWFTDHGVGRGDRVEIPPGIRVQGAQGE
jgi:hypothetical protein